MIAGSVALLPGTRIIQCAGVNPTSSLLLEYPTKRCSPNTVAAEYCHPLVLFLSGKRIVISSVQINKAQSKVLPS